MLANVFSTFLFQQNEKEKKTTFSDYREKYKLEQMFSFFSIDKWCFDIWSVTHEATKAECSETGIEREREHIKPSI